MRLINTTAMIFVGCLCLDEALAQTDLSGTWELSGRSSSAGDEFIAYHEPDTGYFRTIYSYDGETDLIGTVEGTRVSGQFLVYFDEHRAACPDNWVRHTDFQGDVSADGNTLTVRYRVPAINPETCHIIEQDWATIVYRRQAQEACEPPSELANAIANLRRMLSDDLGRRPDLPSEIMFRQEDPDLSETGQLARARGVVDEQIRNGFSDDFLLGQLRPNGTATRFLQEIQAFLDGEDTCDWLAWGELHERLEAIYAPVRDREQVIEALTEFAETHYIENNQRFHTALASTRVDHGIVVRFLEWLGTSHMEALQGATVTRVLSIPTTIAFEISGKSPGALGVIGGAYSSATIVVASIDLLDLREVDREVLPAALEYAELYAYLQPLEDHYGDVVHEFRFISQTVRAHRPSRNDD